MDKGSAEEDLNSTLDNLVAKIKNIEGNMSGKNDDFHMVHESSRKVNTPSFANIVTSDGSTFPKSVSTSDVETFWDPKQSPKVLNTSDGSTFHTSTSFAAVTQKISSNKVVKVKELRSKECVEGAAVAIPFEEVEAVCSRFANTLYGYFIGKRLAFPLVENYVKNTWAKYGLKRMQLHEDFFLFQFDTKEGMDRVLEDGPWMIRREPLMLNVWSQNTDLKKVEIKNAPVWVKFQHVPIVAYSEVGLSLISTQVGKPITLDSYTSNMCVSSWGRSTYARVLIEVSAENELKDELVVAIPKGKDMGHSLATVSIEYEWTPPRCSTCRIFDHLSKDCPNLPKESPVETTTNDGFEVVTKKKKRSKSKNMKQVDGVRLSKPTLNLHYRKVDKTSKPLDSSTQPTKPKPSVDKKSISVSNSFDALDKDDDDCFVNKESENFINDSDSEEVDEDLVMDGHNNKPNENVTEGASTPISNVVNV